MLTTSGTRINEEYRRDDENKWRVAKVILPPEGHGDVWRGSIHYIGTWEETRKRIAQTGL